MTDNDWLMALLLDDDALLEVVVGRREPARLAHVAGRAVGAGEPVEAREKTRRVREVFDSVADRYDLMNDLMSAGAHRLWKRFAVNAARLRPGEWVLDLAGGTGDLAHLTAARTGPNGRAIICDINMAMMAAGRQTYAPHPLTQKVTWVQGDAESIPFPDATFDAAMVGCLFARRQMAGLRFQRFGTQ